MRVKDKMLCLMVAKTPSSAVQTGFDSHSVPPVIKQSCKLGKFVHVLRLSKLVILVILR